MILIHVQHFLNDEGREYFPKWIKETERTLKNFKGFKSLKKATRMEEPLENHLFLEFNNLNTLNRWSTSKEHRKLVNKLKKYSIKHYEAEIYKI
ncbi:MAG: hypothetical protein ACTSW1_13460 [Candidatus Hodarchaeales archaeon]